MPPRLVALLTLVMALWLPAANAEADDGGRPWLQSLALRTAYGSATRDNIQFVSVLPRVSLFFPAAIENPLASHQVHAEFVVEPIVSYITNTMNTVEAGVNPLFFSLRYDRGQQLVPFLEGGEGVLYTGLRGERLGGHFEFSSQGGGGLHWFLDRTTALTISYRIRHISNAGITRVNDGLNTHFFTIGLSFFPSR